MASRHELTGLLALRLACRPRCLAKALLEGQCVDTLLQLHSKAVASSHWQAALRQAVALEALGIATMPITALPAWIRRVTLPVALFVRGNVALLHSQAVAIVGSRQATPQAMAWARAVAARHAQHGAVVVSGGAAGIDAAAHIGAMDVGGQTLAYVGSAIDVVYPAVHRALFARLLQTNGAIVSEHPPLEVTHPHDHARRNRFIAGHGRSLFVAEAARRSGSLGTATWARRLGRPIAVSPEGIARHRGGLTHLIDTAGAKTCVGSDICPCQCCAI